MNKLLIILLVSVTLVTGCDKYNPEEDVCTIEIGVIGQVFGYDTYYKDKGDIQTKTYYCHSWRIKNFCEKNCVEDSNEIKEWSEECQERCVCEKKQEYELNLDGELFQLKTTCSQVRIKTINDVSCDMLSEAIHTDKIIGEPKEGLFIMCEGGLLTGSCSTSDYGSTYYIDELYQIAKEKGCEI